MPNQWALSHRLRGQKELTHATINVKPMGTISQASMSTWTQALNYECQTNGHYLIGCDVNKNISTQLSISNQWARSHKLQCQHGHNLQTINAKPIGMISTYISTRNNYFSHLNQSGVYIKTLQVLFLTIYLINYR